MNQRAVLGRGLSALIPTPSAEPPRMGILTCSVHSIDPSPFQARQSIDTEKIESLAESVRERGVLQPLIVRKVGERYQLIAGERRWRAAQKAGLVEVPILVKDWGDSDAMAVGLVENLQREDLNPVEEALAYQALIEEHQWTHDRLSQEVGRDRTTITNGLRLLKLPIEIQKMLVEGRLSEGHARPLLALEDKKGMIALAEQTIREGLSVRQVEALVRERIGPKKGRDKIASVKKDPYVRQLEEGWTRALGTKVAILPRGQGGTLQISYYSNADLERLGSKLLGKQD